MQSDITLVQSALEQPQGCWHTFGKTQKKVSQNLKELKHTNFLNTCPLMLELEKI